MSNQPTVKGLDIFHGDDPIDFHGAAAAGVKYCFIKASQGVQMVDFDFVGFTGRAKSVAMLTGAYHFFDPTEDPVQQAQHFIRTAAPMKGDLIPALDVEVFSPNVGQQARACADEIKRLCGHNPILYASDSFYRAYLAPSFPLFTLWIARYGPSPITSCQFWQNSDTLHLAGTPHDLDADVFFGTPDDLVRYVIS